MIHPGVGRHKKEIHARITRGRTYHIIFAGIVKACDTFDTSCLSSMMDGPSEGQQICSSKGPTYYVPLQIPRLGAVAFWNVMIHSNIQRQLGLGQQRIAFLL